MSLRQVSLDVTRCRRYGTKNWSPLLQDIPFDIASGQMVALVEGSGEGRSLLLQCPLDLSPDNLRSNGAITLEGKALGSDDIRKCRGNTFSYVPQGTQALNPLLSTEKHLRRARRLSDQQWNTGKIERLLQRSRLESRVLDALPCQLSDGMAKHALACHMSLSQARYILTDEITTWSDASFANRLLEQLHE